MLPVQDALDEVIHRVFLAKTFRPLGRHLRIRQLAERAGFEPADQFPDRTLSKRVPSATRPPLLSPRKGLAPFPPAGKAGGAPHTPGRSRPRGGLAAWGRGDG